LFTLQKEILQSTCVSREPMIRLSKCTCYSENSNAKSRHYQILSVKARKGEDRDKKTFFLILKYNLKYTQQKIHRQIKRSIRFATHFCIRFFKKVIIAFSPFYQQCFIKPLFMRKSQTSPNSGLLL
jgi:hypothetical protein